MDTIKDSSYLNTATTTATATATATDTTNTALNEDDLISSTTTVRRTLSSTVPSLASGYSTITTDRELILLYRLSYRVDRTY
jgi:hypothetical protein